MNQQPLRAVVRRDLLAGVSLAAFTERVHFVLAESEEEVRAALPEATILFAYHVPDIIPAQTPHLRWIQLPSAGVNSLLTLPVWHSDIVITSARGTHAVPVSEHFFALLLALVRGLPTVIRDQQRRVWQHDLSPGEVRGKTLGLVGWGKIGEQVAYLASAFGMRVVGTRRSAETRQEVARPVSAYSDPPFLEPLHLTPDAVYPSSDLQTVLRQSDVVLVLAPLTPETRGLIGEAEFAAMRPGTLFFNLGRGAVVDQAALIQALRAGNPVGAGLDVFEEEPLPTDSPLWSMPNVIVSPHLGGNGSETAERTARLFLLNLARFLAGRPLLNVVERSSGY